MSNNKVQELINEHEAVYADLRFCDTRGKEQHVTVPVSQIDEEFFRMARCSMVHPLPDGRVSMNQTWY